MEIKIYNKAQLEELILSQTFAEMPVLPISTHRAISHIHNPRADPDDILLIIAYENDIMIGYLGVLADYIYTPDVKELKCGWLSCMWVNPTLRGKGIAKHLLSTAFKNWNDHILVTEFTPEAKGLYDRSGGFNDLRINKGLRCYLNFNLHEVLPRKNEKYRAYTSVLKLADTLANIPNAVRLSFLKPTFSGSISFDQITAIDKPLNEYIHSKQTDSLERRDLDDINWILHYPWLQQSPPTTESGRYHFSSVADRFQNICFRLSSNDSIKGYLHYTIRDHHLKVPYAYFEPECLPDVAQHIYQIMQSGSLNMLTIFHPDLVHYFNTHPTPFLYKRAIKRHYIISKALDAHFVDRESLIIQDGDADCAFT